MAFKRILCPTDFSKPSQKAFGYADKLAQTTGAELVLLHVFEMPEGWEPPAINEPADPRVRDSLLAMQSASPDVKIEYVLHGGVPEEVICWLAQERACDLIVIGTHGRSGLMHLLLGSVAEEVIRHARAPVMTVRDRPANEPPLKEPDVHFPMPPML